MSTRIDAPSPRSLPRSLCLTLFAVTACFDPAPPPTAEAEAEGSSGASTAADPSMTPGGSTGEGGSSGEPPASSEASSSSSDSTSDSTTGDETGETSSGSETGEEPEPPPSCGGRAGLCVSVPEQWNGPVTLATTTLGETPDCGGAPEQLSARGNVDAPEASCACECADATGASCSEAVLTAWGDDGTCGGTEVFSQTLVPGGDGCNFMPSGEATGDVPVADSSFWSMTTSSSGGACAPQSTFDVPAASYREEVAGCGTQPLEGECDGGASCIDAGGTGSVCVWQAGDHACPAGDFSERTVYFRGDISDGRSCTACSCGTPQGSCPTTEARLHEGYYCNGPSVGIRQNCEEACFGPGCETYAISAGLSLGAAQASCEPSTSEVQGAATGTDPVTVCCSAT